VKKLFKAALTAATLAGMLAIPSQVHAGADSTQGDILGIVGSDTTYYVMNALTDAHNLSARYNPNGDKAVNIPPLVSANANVEAGEATLATVSWLKNARLAWPGGAVLPADANCTTQYVFGGAGSMDGDRYKTPTPSTTVAPDGDVADGTDTPFTAVTSVPGGPTGGTYDVRLGVQPPNGSGDGQKAITAYSAVKGVTYASGCLDIGRSSSAPSSSNGCTSTACESWAFALDAIGWTYFPGNTQTAVSSGITTADFNKIYQCATSSVDVNLDGDYFDTGDMKIGYPKIQYWNQLTADSNVSVEPTKIAAYRIQPGSGTGKDAASIFMNRTDGIDSEVLKDCDGLSGVDKDGDANTSFTFPIVQEHDCRNVADAVKARAICFYGYSRWVLQARSLETDKRNGAVFGKFGPNSSELKRPSFSTINTSSSRYKGSRYVYNVLPLNAGADLSRTPDARRFVGVSLQPTDCADGSELAVVANPSAVPPVLAQSAVDCNFDGDLTDTSVAVGAVPGFICGDATARRIIASFGFKPIASGLTSLTNAAYGTSYCRYNQTALSNS